MFGKRKTARETAAQPNESDTSQTRQSAGRAYGEKQGESEDEERRQQRDQPSGSAKNSMPPPAMTGRILRSRDRKPTSGQSAGIPRRGTRRHDREDSVPSVTTSNSHPDDDSRGQSNEIGPQGLAVIPEQNEARKAPLGAPGTVKRRLTPAGRPAFAGVSSTVDGPASLPSFLQRGLASIGNFANFRYDDASVTDTDPEETPAEKAVIAANMQGFLHRLLDAADDLQKHLAAGPGDEIWEGRLYGFKQAFEMYRGHYVLPGAPYIKVDDVLKRTSQEKTSAKGIQTNQTITAANLVSLLDDIAVASKQKHLPLGDLQSWDMNFPASFVPRRYDGRLVLDSDAFGLALQIRIQRFIETLHKFYGQHQSPFIYAMNVFCEEPHPSVEDFRGFVHGENQTVLFRKFPGLDELDYSPFFESCSTQLKSICSMLSDDNEKTNLAQLEQSYPWDAFIDNIKSWAQATFELARDFAKGGPQQLAASQGLLVSDEPRTGPRRDPRLVTERIVRTASVPSAVSLLTIPDSVGAIKIMEHRDIQGTPPSAQRPSGPITNEDIIEDDQQTGAAQNGHSALGSSPDMARNYSIQSADSARDLGFMEEAPLYPDLPVDVNARGRPRGQSDEDDEFETDTRVPPHGRRTDGPPAKRARVAAPVSGPPGPASSPPAASPLSSQPFSRDGMEPFNPGVAYSDPNLLALTQRSREISLAARKPKTPQIRVPWSKPDIRTLITAVNAFGARWSVIEREIKAGTITLEHTRDQQALRDKARLLKQDFLKTDSLLPPGFDLVILGRKEREAVLSCGKNPDRGERDVDANGEPVNTTSHAPEPPTESSQPGP